MRRAKHASDSGAVLVLWVLPLLNSSRATKCRSRYVCTPTTRMNKLKTQRRPSAGSSTQSPIAMAQTSMLPFQSASGGYSSLSVTGKSTSPQSRTMMYARTVIAPATPSTALTKPADTAVRLRSAAALNSTEQYWAARALTAEAALSVRAAFHQEVYVLTESHEEKRAHELAELQRIHDERHAKLERLVLILLGCLFAFVSAILYILFRQHTDYRSSRWCLPSHFTIPVLSPFTSVVEHETSVFNTRSITIVLLVLAALAYACFRYWLSHLRHR